MKKYLVLLVAITYTCSIQSQVVRGLRIGYIDMEYILQNVPDYTEAKNALEQKAQLWKQEVSTKTNEINKLKESLKTERVLLTRELIEEREEEIAFQEKELLDYQQKRFGPTGDLMVQRAVLTKPVQDQVFTAVQDIAEQRKYDFVFDKSSDLTMIFAAKQFDISEMVIRKLSRTSKRSQLSKSELKQEAIKEYKEDTEDANSDFAIRKKMLEDKKAARDSLIAARKAEKDQILADRKATADAQRAAAVAKRQEAIDKKNGVKTESSPATKPEEAGDPEKPGEEKPATEKEKPASAKDKPVSTEGQPTAAELREKQIAEREAQKQAILAAKKKEIEDRKKELEERKAKMIKDREDARKAKEATRPATK